MPTVKAKTNKMVFEDLGNVLMLILKFLLVVIAALYLVLNEQLGIEVGVQTALVNATSETQVSPNGDFVVSFYPLVFSSDVDAELVLHTLLCPRDCTPVDWASFQPGVSPGGGWTVLASDSPQMPGKRAENEKIAPRAVTVSVDPRQLGLRRKDTFQVTYAVDFVMAGFLGEWSGQRTERQSPGRAFTVVYEPPFVPDNSLVLAVQTIKQGRRAAFPVPEGLQVQQSDPQAAVQIQSEGGNQWFWCRPRAALGRHDLQFDVLTTVAGLQGNTLSIQNPDAQVQVDGNTQCLRFSDDNSSAENVSFDSIQPGDSVWVARREDGTAESVFFNSSRENRLALQASFIVLENLPPRAIFREQDQRGRTVDNVAVINFPVDFLRDDWDGELKWYLDLNEHLIDPDGVLNDKPEIAIPYSDYPNGNRVISAQSSNYQLIDSPFGRGAFLVISDTAQVAPDGVERIQIPVRDEANSRTITLEFRRLDRDTRQLYNDIWRR